MQAASWSDVWHLGLTVFAHQRIELQILIGLGAAFSALMVIEGLRANFFPRRRAEASKPATAPESVVIEPQPIHQAMPPMRSFAVTQPQRMARNPKRSVARPRTQKAPRPTIKRAANVNYSEIAAE